MDIEQYIIGDRVTVDWAKGLRTRIVVITQPGEENKQFSKPQVSIEHEGNAKDWILNKMTMLNLKKKWGSKTEEWVGKKVRLEIQDIRGRDSVIGYPYDDPSEKDVI